MYPFNTYKVQQLVNSLHAHPEIWTSGWWRRKQHRFCRCNAFPPVPGFRDDPACREARKALLSTIFQARPTIVTICGSTKFRREFEEAQLQETLAGRIVLTVGGYLHSDERAAELLAQNNNKAKVDTLHLRKIDLSDEILVINVGGYIGESTQREIAHAVKQSKRIRYLEAPDYDAA